jgi:hypothetical protein
MGQFKPMVKMETTEPSVVLKLKKGGSVAHGHKPMHKAMGGSMGAMMAPVGNPRAARAMAMRKPKIAAIPAPIADRPMMKKGGSMKHDDVKMDKAMIKKAFKQHDAQEHKSGKGTELKLKAGGASSFANTKMVTGEKDSAKGTNAKPVKMGAAGYKTGGTISEGAAKKYLQTDMNTGKVSTEKGTAAKPVKMGNKGGFKTGGQVASVPGAGVNMNVVTAKGGVTGTATGGVRNANAGGFKKGGAAKKHYATGGEVKSGSAAAMPQGKKKASEPVAITKLSGTFKRGGQVKKMAEGGLSGMLMAPSSSNPNSASVTPSGGGSTARGGLQGVQAGAQTLNDALSAIESSVGGGGGGAPGGSYLPQGLKRGGKVKAEKC